MQLACACHVLSRPVGMRLPYPGDGPIDGGGGRVVIAAGKVERIQDAAAGVSVMRVAQAVAGGGAGASTPGSASAPAPELVEKAKQILQKQQDNWVRVPLPGDRPMLTEILLAQQRHREELQQRAQAASATPLAQQQPLASSASTPASTAPPQQDLLSPSPAPPPSPESTQAPAQQHTLPRQQPAHEEQSGGEQRQQQQQQESPAHPQQEAQERLGSPQRRDASTQQPQEEVEKEKKQQDEQPALSQQMMSERQEFYREQSGRARQEAQRGEAPLAAQPPTAPEQASQSARAAASASTPGAASASTPGAVPPGSPFSPTSPAPSPSCDSEARKSKNRKKKREQKTRSTESGGPEAAEEKQPFRRQGLPSRILANRKGDEFQDVGGVDLAVNIIASILETKREVIADAGAAHIPTWKQAVWRSGRNSCLQRKFQEEVFDSVFYQWWDGPGAVREAQALQKAHVRASTPGGARKNGKVVRAMKGYFKTWCFQNLGGQHWAKFLIALDDVPREAIEATNKVIDERMFDRRGQRAGPNAQPVDGHCLPRHSRASTLGGGRKRKLEEAQADANDRAGKRRRTQGGRDEPEQATGRSENLFPTTPGRQSHECPALAMHS